MTVRDSLPRPCSARAWPDRRNTQKPNRYKWESEQLHDYIPFMANTGLRPDEANRTLNIVMRRSSRTRAVSQTILEIEVRGKRAMRQLMQRAPAGQ